MDDLEETIQYRPARVEELRSTPSSPTRARQFADVRAAGSPYLGRRAHNTMDSASALETLAYMGTNDKNAKSPSSSALATLAYMEDVDKNAKSPSSRSALEELFDSQA